MKYTTITVKVTQSTKSLMNKAKELGSQFKTPIRLYEHVDAAIEKEMSYLINKLKRNGKENLSKEDFEKIVEEVFNK